MSRNPSKHNEPNIDNKPLSKSEPWLQRKPHKYSEPRERSKPLDISEPMNRSNPIGSSEPSDSSKPMRESEPLGKRKPQPLSEPRLGRNPSYKSKPEKISNPLRSSGFNREAVRNLVEIYYDVQDVRIRSFNRLRQVGEVKGVNPNLLKKLEKQVKDYITHEIKNLPIYKNFLKPVKGIGPILSGGILAWLDPYKAKHASSFWKYCGLHVIDDKAIKRQKGKKLGFNVKMRVLAWKIAKSFVRQKTPFYRQIYDKTKLQENDKLGNPIENPQKCPHYQECAKQINLKAKRTKTTPKKLPCKLHIDYRAMRKMVKRFLADLWVRWRSLEGLPVSEPYAIAILKHHKAEENPE